MTITQTPEVPYYAVIFTSTLSKDTEGYEDMANKMVELTQQQPGFLGADSAREALGITVSYWQSLEAIASWKQQSEHLVAQKLGRERWYQNYSIRISKVERQYFF